MATLSLNAPDAYVATIASGVRAAYGEAVEALTNTDAIKHAMKAHLKELVRRYSQRNATSAERTAAETALTDKETAAATAIQARKNAETAALAQVDTDFAGVS